MAQDKELALGVGLAKLSRDDIRKVNDGKAIELACVLNGTCFIYLYLLMGIEHRSHIAPISIGEAFRRPNSD